MVTQQPFQKLPDTGKKPLSFRRRQHAQTVRFRGIIKLFILEELLSFEESKK